ncbi:hypothetical protein SO694_00007249 [Aureococcus anophagefferens]|uniref:RRM domain-containing protein n=1 Tax=Aureococcus anophagefferens TaxID=44056 RepID=A0ABR1GAU0_AURAN
MRARGALVLCLLDAAAAEPASLFSEPMSAHFDYAAAWRRGGAGVAAAGRRRRRRDERAAVERRGHPGPARGRRAARDGRATRPKPARALARAPKALEASSSKFESAGDLVKTLGGRAPTRRPAARPAPRGPRQRRQRQAARRRRAAPGRAANGTTAPPPADLVFRGLALAGRLGAAAERVGRAVERRSGVALAVLAFAIGRASKPRDAKPASRIMAVLRYLVVAAALYAAAAPGGGDDVPAVADTPAEPPAPADWLASLLFARRSLETIWAAGLRRHVSERARGVLLETMAYYDGSFEVLEASVDFGAGLPPLHRVETREPTPALVDALRPGAKMLAYAVEVGDWALEAPGGFASLDLELQGRFAKYAVPRLGVTFESATIAASTLVVAVEVTDAYPFLGTAAFGFDGAAGRPRLDATSFVGAEAARADFEFAPFGSMVADEIHRSLPVAQRDVWTFDLGAWLVTCDGGGQSNATRREAPEPAPIPEEPVSRKTPPPTRVVDRVRELDALCDDGAPRRGPLRKLNAPDVSADREPTARELLAAARSVQRERDSILADAEAKRNAAEAFARLPCCAGSAARQHARPRTVTPRPSAQGAKVDPLRDYPHHLLGFSVTAERLKAFFTSQDVPGTLKVRLLTDAKTGKSRGMALAQCETAEALYACVALHHAQIDGRRINVERSAGGGREAKKGKLAEHRAHQSKKVEETVDRVLEEFVASGQLRRDEVDDGVRRLLQRRSGRVAHAALTEYARSSARQRSAPYQRLPVRSSPRA